MNHFNFHFIFFFNCPSNCHWNITILVCSDRLKNWFDPQFHIKLLYRPHFGTWTLPFGLLGSNREISETTEFLLFEVVFSTFWGQIFFFKLGYHSNFNFEVNTDRGSIESLSIALGCESMQNLDFLFAIFFEDYRIICLRTNYFCSHRFVLFNLSNFE